MKVLSVAVMISVSLGHEQIRMNHFVLNSPELSKGDEASLPAKFEQNHAVVEAIKKLDYLK